MHDTRTNRSAMKGTGVVTEDGTIQVRLQEVADGRSGDTECMGRGNGLNPPRWRDRNRGWRQLLGDNDIECQCPAVDRPNRVLVGKAMFVHKRVAGRIVDAVRSKVDIVLSWHP